MQRVEAPSNCTPTYFTMLASILELFHCVTRGRRSRYILFVYSTNESVSQHHSKLQDLHLKQQQLVAARSLSQQVSPGSSRAPRDWHLPRTAHLKQATAQSTLTAHPRLTISLAPPQLPLQPLTSRCRLQMRTFSHSILKQTQLRQEAARPQQVGR